jgi:protein-S-isoprenylcysteine O-methyltransferase Ste14
MNAFAASIQDGPEGAVSLALAGEPTRGLIHEMIPRAALTMSAMVHGPEDTVAYRLWPPVAIGAPLLVGWLVTLVWGDPVDLGAWRVPIGWALTLFFVGWNGWSLWLFGRHQTGLLPGQATNAIIEEGPFRVSRNPLYVGLLALYLGLALLAPTFWGLVLFPAAVMLVLWGAIRPEERFLHERFGAPYDDYTRRVRRWL